MSFNLLWLVLVVIVVMALWEAFGKGSLSKRKWFVIGIFFVLGMTVLGWFFMQTRQDIGKLSVTGYASKTFESDMVKWTLSVQKNTGIGGLMEATKSMNKDVNSFKALLLEKGVAAKDISIQPPTSQPLTDYEGHLTGYNISQMIYVMSTDMDMLEGIALDTQFFAERGLLLEMSNLEYLYSKLPELKKEMIGMATADAVERAKEIVGASKTRLGKLHTARTGVFQITEPYSTDVSDYGYYNTSTRQKSIAVTVSASFKL